MCRISLQPTRGDCRRLQLPHDCRVFTIRRRASEPQSEAHQIKIAMYDVEIGRIGQCWFSAESHADAGGMHHIEVIGTVSDRHDRSGINAVLRCPRLQLLGLSGPIHHI